MSMHQNALSIDVEEYYHANNLNIVRPPSTWESLPSRVEGSTRQILEILDDYNVQATFFILGLVAEKYPSLVRAIFDAGHEVASHGYAHKLVYENTKEHFVEDIGKSKKILEDIIGEKVSGYRAPSFSIKDSTPWAYGVLVEAGYVYDSSLHPIWHPRYANADKPRVAHKIGDLWIVPIGTAEIFNKCRLPCAGGAYWRLFPRALCDFLMKKAGTPFTCYFHPWEMDPEQPRIKELGALTSLRHYGGIAKFEDTLKYFLTRHSFSSIKEAYQIGNS